MDSKHFVENAEQTCQPTGTNGVNDMSKALSITHEMVSDSFMTGTSDSMENEDLKNKDSLEKKRTMLENASESLT